MKPIRPLTLAACAALALLGSPAAHAQWLDAYRTQRLVSDTPAAPLLKNASCVAEVADRPLELEDAILQAVCANPQARLAWANARAQAAAVGVSEAAFLPTINATGGYERDTLSTTYDYSKIGLGSIRNSQNSSSKYGMLNLSWVLFDFGKRSAGLRQARQLLEAANAAQDDALQTVFFNAAQAYYAVRDAQAALDAARQTERIAGESLAEARAKHDAGAGTLSDQLQAQTAYRRALLDRVSAEGDAHGADGALAVAMGLDANTPLRVAPAPPLAEHDAFAQGVDQLLDEAKARQPKLVAARAKLQAARENVDVVRAQGRPTISLVGSLSQNNPSYQQQPQSVPITASRGSTIGVQVTIPLFEGFASGYRVAQAQAQADAREAELRNTELQVSLEVWKSYQSVQTDTANLDNSHALLADAQRALDIARGRYKAGVGTFTELQDTQAALADARKQRVLAVSKWRTSRLRLAASLGNLGLWSVQ
ncbi:TolC family protein [Burkholderia sp. FERM BP-3421]|jgi:outer membrane protein|uniref:TolC family protein n=1 Tax=Burkholderia sp. FERM BP-3421 TaxID=1494466 RepID=UPI00236079C9|nr:TolC family protein [Burkholderia sp. FERM BP-3421]WDD96179.1 TolC family protein [Burkholderia sp. FERM BP-3421]